MNEKQMRDVAENLRKQASAIENSLSAPDMNRVDYEPAYKLGTRHIEYVNGIRCVHRYVKIDAGSLGIDTDTGKEYRYLQFRWLR